MNKQQKGGGVIDKILLPLGLIGLRKTIYFKNAFNTKKKRIKKYTSKKYKFNKSKKYRKK